MRGHIRKRITWEYILELGDWPAQRCTICSRRFWVERRKRPRCPKCAGKLKDTVERRQRCQAGFHTRKEAEEALADAITAQNKGLQVSPEKLTLAQYLEEEWLPAIAGTIRATTLASYTTHVKRHIIPRLGRTPLRRLTGAQINGLYAVLGNEGKVCGKGGLAPNSVRRVHATLHRALRDAVRWGYLCRNPVDSADPPKTGSDQRGDMKTWSVKDLKKFLESTKDSRLYPLWHTMAMTGLRRGEALALRWEDVDLKAGRISVRRSHVPVGATVIVSQPKTRRGTRLLSIDPGTVAVLKKRCQHQREERLAWDGAWNETGLVFTRENGSMIHPERATKNFASAVKKAGVPGITLHGLRHTNATLALAAGVHAKIISERLGHATVSLTLDVYSHAIPALSEEAASTIAALIL